MNTKIQTILAYTLLMMFTLQIFPRVGFAGDDELVYPLKKVSTLECRFQDFDTLSGNCIEDFTILQTKDYVKYATLNSGYNDFTRRFTVLWGGSYKYGWDVGSGGHQGTDIATAKGTPVYSIAQGKVITSSEDLAWGKHVSIEHTIQGKKIVSNYAHLSTITVKKGDSVGVGEKIGEVGSTGNSTGNHLHFQIDLPSKFHPYYYDYKSCPYSYYDITEKGVCFDELQKNTFDPLAFLESNGGILNTKESPNASSIVKIESSSTSNKLPSIFDITVYHGFGNPENVKQVQTVMNKLGYYEGSLSGDYADIEKSIIKYQLASGVIEAETDDGAGWFGPKTRAQAKKDYFALGNKDIITTQETSTESVTPQVTQKIETISRENLMTREEIEAREVQEFLDIYEINFTNPILQISENETRDMQMKVTTPRGKSFRGNSPGSISFIYDESKISVFPRSFYNFSDGERDISITGKTQGNTTISVKIGDKIVKTFSITVARTGEVPKVDTGKIYTAKEVSIAEAVPAIVLLKDQYGNKMVRTSFAGEFSITADKNTMYCVKKGSLSDIKALYKRPCLEEEFKNSLSFTYADTVGGLLVFEYKVYDQATTNMKLTQVSSKKELTKNTIQINTPKGLATKHPYYESIVSGLKSGVLTGIKTGYFLEERDLTQTDAVIWIENIMRRTSSESSQIAALKKEVQGTFETLTRKEFALLTQKYLGTQNTSVGKEYLDLEEEEEILIAGLVGQVYTWKDNFGERYFQPDKNITRGEAAYFLTKTLETQGKTALVRK